jgi:hypothetical protein
MNPIQVRYGKLLKKRVFLLLQISTVLVFFGRAYQHLFWDAPFRAFFWDEGLLKGVIEGWFNRTWEEYVTDLSVDQGVAKLIVATGIFYLLCGLAALFIRRLPKWTNHLILLGALGLLFLAMLYWKEKFYHWGQLLEYAIQVGSPVFLWAWSRPTANHNRLISWMKVATALTFVCHGLYAVGYYPRPENFTSMTISILGISESGANQLLVVAGILDFVAAVLLFLPGKWAWPALFYCVGWGLATAVARVWANYYPDFWMESLHQWTYHTVYRIPHSLIPLALFIWQGSRPSSADLHEPVSPG